MVTTLRLLFIASLLFFGTCAANAQQTAEDKDQLGMALEYFQTGKYHEALLLFTKLERRYTLNPRYHAYMGVCHYYEWEWEEAVKKFIKYLPKLTTLAPRELGFYNYACAESLFFLGKYQDAIQYYEQMLTLCYEKERGDALFRLGFCHMQLGQPMQALEYLTDAEAYYQRFPLEEKEARAIQLGNMIKGLRKQLETHQP